MFMIVSYPWPDPSAHVQLAGTDPATFRDGIDNWARAEKLVRWTCREWLRFSWYRLRLTSRDNIAYCVAMGLQAWIP